MALSTLADLEARALVDDSARGVLADAYLEKGFERAAAYLRAPSVIGKPRAEVMKFVHYWDDLPASHPDEDKALFELSVRDSYRSAGLAKKTPDVFWVESPPQVVVGAIELSSVSKKEGETLDRLPLSAERMTRLRRRLYSQVKEPVKASEIMRGHFVYNSNLDERNAAARVLNPIYRQLEELFESLPVRNPYSTLRPTLAEQVASSWMQFLGGEATFSWWQNLPTTCNRLLLPSEPDRRSLRPRVFRRDLALFASGDSAAIWFPYKNYVVACPKPSITRQPANSRTLLQTFHARWPDDWMCAATLPVQDRPYAFGNIS